MAFRKDKALDVLLKQIDAAAPNRDKTSDGWIGDASHAARRSDHNPDSNGIVHAIDITHDPVNFDAHKWVREVLVKCGDGRLKYVISSGKVWDPVRGWHKYNGPNPHNKHVHVSVNHSDNPKPWKLNTFKVFAKGKLIAGAYRNPEGLTIVPLRALAEALGFTVTFDEATNEVRCEYNP